MKILAISILMVLWLFTMDVNASIVDMEIIKQIESSGNPWAINHRSGARGLYQIRSICLADYNQYHTVKYKHSDLFDPEINTKIAKWYLECRIPQLLRHYKHDVNLSNIIVAYNAGISYVGKQWPQETVSYIALYKKLYDEKK